MIRHVEPPEQPEFSSTGGRFGVGEGMPEDDDGEDGREDVEADRDPENVVFRGESSSGYGLVCPVDDHHSGRCRVSSLGLGLFAF